MVYRSFVSTPCNCKMRNGIPYSLAGKYKWALQDRRCTIRDRASPLNHWWRWSLKTKESKEQCIYNAAFGHSIKSRWLCRYHKPLLTVWDTHTHKNLTQLRSADRQVKDESQTSGQTLCQRGYLPQCLVALPCHGSSVWLRIWEACWCTLASAGVSQGLPLPVSPLDLFFPIAFLFHSINLSTGLWLFCSLCSKSAVEHAGVQAGGWEWEGNCREGMVL